MLSFRNQKLIFDKSRTMDVKHVIILKYLFKNLLVTKIFDK